jgi:Ion transport protein
VRKCILFSLAFSFVRSHLACTLPDLKESRRLAEAAEKRWGALQVVSRAAHGIVSHSSTTYLVMCVILGNTAILALDKYPLWDPQSSANFDLVNFAFTMFFTMEMVLKLLGSGVRGYFRDKLNAFDCFVVTISVLDVSINPPADISSGGMHIGATGVASVFRMLRLFRIFRLARNWPSFGRLLSTIIKTLKDLANFTLLLIIVIYVFALVGLQLFANRLRFDVRTHLAVMNVTCGACSTIEIPRSNFDTLQYSMMSVFQSISTANWNNIMYDARRARGTTGEVYCISLMVIGWLIVLNLFVSILLVRPQAGGGDARVFAMALPLGPILFVGDLTGFQIFRWSNCFCCVRDAVSARAGMCVGIVVCSCQIVRALAGQLHRGRSWQ